MTLGTDVTFDRAKQIIISVHHVALLNNSTKKLQTQTEAMRPLPWRKATKLYILPIMKLIMWLYTECFYQVISNFFKEFKRYGVEMKWGQTDRWLDYCMPPFWGIKSSIYQLLVILGLIFIEQVDQTKYLFEIFRYRLWECSMN